MKKIFGVYLAPLSNKTAFKIGKSIEPNKRLNHLSRFYDFCPSETLIIQCVTEKQSFQIESCLHKALENHNVSLDFEGGTEFFNYTKFKEAVAIGDLLCSLNGLLKLSFKKDTSIQKAPSSEILATQIANRVKSERIEQNLKQKELAKLAAVGVRTVQRLEIDGQCTLDCFVKIVCALKMQDGLFKSGFKNAGSKRVKKIFVGLSDHEPEREGWIYDTGK
jgi:DNA-binding XRE family transcriptional regulator